MSGEPDRWEDAERRAARLCSPADLALRLRQRFAAVHLDESETALVAYHVALFCHQAADLVRLLDEVLLAAPGQGEATRRGLVLLYDWAGRTEALVREMETPLVAVIEGAGDAEEREELLSEAQAAAAAPVTARPEEAAKLAGRYRHWHLLMERLDLQLAGAQLPGPIRYPLARHLAVVYEECLLLMGRWLRLSAPGEPRRHHVLRLLLDTNAALHFHLLQQHLGPTPPAGGRPVSVGLRTWLLIGITGLDGNNLFTIAEP